MAIGGQRPKSTVGPFARGGGINKRLSIVANFEQIESVLFNHLSSNWTQTPISWPDEEFDRNSCPALNRSWPDGKWESQDILAFLEVEPLSFDEELGSIAGQKLHTRLFSLLKIKVITQIKTNDRSKFLARELTDIFTFQQIGTVHCLETSVSGGEPDGNWWTRTFVLNFEADLERDNG